MKDLMNELGKKVNEVVEQIGKSTEPLVNKTQEVVEIQKVKAQIRNLENNNECDLCDLGEIVYAKYKDGIVEDEDFVAICEEIEQRLEAIDELEKYIADIKGVAICSACEMAVDKGACFCSNCGAPIVKTEKNESAEEEIFEEEHIFEEGDVVEVVETEDEEIEIELIVEEVK